ncbi:probable uracil phosphoribosyltransferase [Thalassiosira pseudonana CCMP1335]|uniref:uracil phosphoribosyltransferase n=1 Tax=Thalassiosira pseudonana TaxID=35128 RepID=B8BYV0_THAPS|nr:probable uracil phosphoribosyltransferase [Thalassiosira pseudonana CCMP1335]EED93951.1 probable uracil phosphoribosyltransferase [Thalassiosira pseudonana CCMP1335]|eukprot:scaffold4900_cov193-Alexandrium_tamarense.AAC.6
MASEDVQRSREVHPNLVVMKSKALAILFTKIRDEQTNAADFVNYSKRAMRLLAEETISYLPATPHTVTTPTNVPYHGQLSIVDTDPDKVCAVSIVRAGDSLLESFREIIPGLRVGKLWIQRNESSTTKEAVHSCTKLPKGMSEMTSVILCDPMLATGGSSITALDILVKEHGVQPEKIVFANVICCPEGLEALASAYPKVKIVTSWVDDGLNESKYILPGLGDYGDRFFNTV